MTQHEILSLAIAEQRIAEELKKRSGVLNLAFLDLEELPSSLWKLAHLNRLVLAGNQLTSISNDIGQLINLESLHASNNRLRNLPESIGDLKKLNYLSVSDNQLTILPDKLGDLDSLERLHIEDNTLTELPHSLQNLKRLEQLFLHRNDKLGIPIEVLGATAHDVSRLGKLAALPNDILTFYFRMLSGSRPLNEVKLILVGRGAVGKTSIVNRLLGNPFNPEEDKTEGIQISSWSRDSLIGRVRFHIWDFGGQEIMHATHQFFLTERSLYLLILTGREGSEDHDAQYWLKLINSFGGDSAVIVVLNKADQHPFDLNRRALKERYSQIRDFVHTDCKSGKGLSELHGVIGREVATLNGVRAQFPVAWFAIKEKLSSMKSEFGTSYIGYDRYRALCSELGETDKKAQDDLATFLHCLGIALNYKDDPRLYDTSVLNPQWVTLGIYKLLNSHSLSERKGVLRLSDLRVILDASEYPPEKHGFLLELMRKFKLCFAFPDDDGHRYLIPELLDKQEPNLGETFNPETCLNLEYRYVILPEGLLPSFIVRTHILSTNQPRWRSGVVLEWEDCAALVKADTADLAKQRVVIRVTGGTPEGRRRLLAVIRWDFERIHQEIPKLEASLKVLPPGRTDRDEPVDYHELEVLERNGIDEYHKVLGNKLVKLNVHSILNGVNVEQISGNEFGIDLPDSALRVFISYSHKDDRYREQLDTHLKLLERQREISTWSDRKLLAGDVWGSEIDHNLMMADIILLLVSPDFIASKYCYEIEMAQAIRRHEERQARVIPIILRDCDWSQTPFARLQATPKDGKPVTRWSIKDAAWNDIAKGIRRVATELRKQRSEHLRQQRGLTSSL